MVRLTDSDGGFDYHRARAAASSKGLQGGSRVGSPKHSDSGDQTARKKKVRRRRKRTSSSSPKNLSEAPSGSEAALMRDPFDGEEDTLASVCSPRRSLMKRRLRNHQEETEQQQGELGSSSSNESMQSSRWEGKTKKER